MTSETNVRLGTILVLIGVPLFHGALSAGPPEPKTQGEKTGAEKKNDKEDESNLRKAVERFVAAADKTDVATLKAIYDPAFLCVRVADEGGMTKLTGDQMLGFMSAMRLLAGGRTLPTKDTAIHHVEIIGVEGFVLLTRTKDLGHGWEPMYYNLVWKRHGGEWRLLREFVHQRTMPKFVK